MIKSVFAFIALPFALSSCVLVPDSWFNDASNEKLFDSSAARSYTIMPPPPETIFNGTETVYQRNYILNKRMIAHIGAPVLRIQGFTKQNYVTGRMMLEEDVEFKTEYEFVRLPAREYPIYGMFEINGDSFFVLPPQNGVYLLADMSGVIQDRFLHRIRNSDKVSLYREKGKLTPKRPRLKRMAESFENKTPFVDYEVLYDGIKNNQITFFFKHAVPGTNGEQGSFESLAYPKDSTIISLAGATMRIIRADKEKLEFIVLKNARD